MTDTFFSIVYDGDPVAEGTIDARDLAPALLGLADLIDEAAPLVDPNLPRLSLRIRPNFKEGSFEVFLELSNLYARFVSIFSGPDAQAWSALFGILGLAGAPGLFQLIRRSKGKKPTTVVIEHTERVSVTFEGEEPVEVDPRVWQLFQRPKARLAVEKVVTPLLDRGYSLLELRRKGRDTITITENEAPYFIAPRENEGETITESNTRVVIVSPSFQPGNKWRVSDGSRNIHVSIMDDTFQTAVQTGSESFRKGDMLTVTLSTRQWIQNGKLSVDYSIVKVHRHEPGPEQSLLL